MEKRIRVLRAVLVVAASAAISGCFGGKPAAQRNQNFFTSGSKEADQRASQRMAQAEQLGGSGEGAGEKGVKEVAVTNKTQAASTNGAATTNKAPKAESMRDLYDRLGGQTGVSNIVSEFLPRAMQDPRVNWDRKGVTRGGFSIKRGESVAWDSSPANVALLKKHLVEFLSLATGGPSRYEGKDIQQCHAHLHISNTEFDASIGDLKVTLDKLQVPNTEQKELLAIVESTRPEIVTER